MTWLLQLRPFGRWMLILLFRATALRPKPLQKIEFWMIVFCSKLFLMIRSLRG